MIYNGDCLEVLTTLEENSIDTCVTDPPYGLGFMGKQWDTFDKSQFGIAGNEGENDLKVKKNFKVLPRYCKDGLQEFTYEWAKEVYRVLKPGAILLAFGGTRTYHRIVCAIEDAGFEIRDTIAWVYGSGFPKSYDISKGIDKKPMADRVTEWKKWLAIQIDKCGKTKQEINDECGFTATSYTKTDGKDYWSTNLPKNGKWETMKKVIGISTNIYDWVAEDNCDERGYVEPTGGLAGGSGNTVGCFSGKQLSSKPISPEAQRWQGWGTALKPAFEPIVVAMKPIDGTYVNNALTWGVAGFWIDGGRVEYAEQEPDNRVGTDFVSNNGDASANANDNQVPNKYYVQLYKPNGRFPANFVHDGSDEVVELFPQTTSGNLNHGHKRGDGTGNSFMGGGGVVQGNYGGDSGSAARFFYCAKASRSERNAGLEGADTNIHPTVKPIELMRYLVRLTKTPTGGVVLDPFAGSGTTGIACVLEGRDFIGIEREADYVEIAEKRIEHYKLPILEGVNANI